MIFHAIEMDPDLMTAEEMLVLDGVLVQELQQLQIGQTLLL
jgi:hypothetical protein